MKLTEYLKRNSLTQAEFGQRLNPPMTQANLSHIMTGRSRISLDRALEIQEVTGGEVPVTEWVGGHAHGSDQDTPEQSTIPGNSTYPAPGSDDRRHSPAGRCATDHKEAA